MRFAINTPNVGLFSDVRLLAQLAHEAEDAGWDGFFLWDHIGSGSDWPWPMQVADPWIALTAMAMTTKRIKIGPLVTPLPRRRPWQVAREAVSLDHLSNGRLILGVGIGSDFAREFSCFGEDGDDKRHAEMLDEGLEVLTKLWSGEAFSYTGKHYQISNALFLPKPLQQPHIPIWLAGIWPNKKPFQRAARWDGISPNGRDHPLTPQDFREMIAYIHERRGDTTPFDVLMVGRTTGVDKERDREKVSTFAAAGVTWWQEGLNWNHSLEQVRRRIQQGPPRP